MQKIIILDCGSQVTQLIGRRLRELNVYCEIQPYSKPVNLTPEVHCRFWASATALSTWPTGWEE